MADTNTNCNISLPQTHKPNPTFEPLLLALDPISLILNHNSSNSDNPFPLRLTSVDSFILERGPNYTAYAELRESRLHMKCLRLDQQQQEAQVLEPSIKPATPPRKKQVKFQACERHSKGSFSIAQSVPDFSASLRKENRKPVNTLPSMTPPSKSGNGVVLSSRGSKSVSGGEKKKGGGGSVMARKSYACIDELKSLSSATAIAINGEGRGGGRSNKVMGKTVSGYHRQF